MLRLVANRPASGCGLCLLRCCAVLLWAMAAGHAASADNRTENQAEPLRIVIPPLEESSRHHTAYFPTLLELALSRTLDSHGPYVIETYPHLFTNARFLAELRRNGVINVMWTTLDEQRSQDLLAVPISLLRGLNSYRVFLIREEDMERFQAIESLEDLRLLRAGQGAHWPDTQVLEMNQLPVVTSVHYELLFSMLAGNRFDYFPRGLYEVWDEQRLHQDKGLIIEPNLMIYYPSPFYFSVSPDNRELAERIEAGLLAAEADGSLDELFFSVPGFTRGHRELESGKRRLFELEHPWSDIPHLQNAHESHYRGSSP